MEYVVVKWLHVLSSTVLFGTGIGSAYYMFFASRTGDARTVANVVKLVVIADWVFTTSTIVIQPVTGLWLAHLAQFPLTSAWILWSIVLYFVAGACWLPVVAIQIRMRKLAETAAAANQGLPAEYLRLWRWWTALGVPAFVSLVIVFYLMVAKPM
ncbi:DUF2269 family protein [Piscinibacter koreensis]|uniref:DUF2269 domain-containing protein n=1 Tax=Piscinibacter koreensis TaxID=2742824 RepID=A0A7Y6NMP4_9BURK|nr:DUF2269 domain-containing protein [Schlegelella koreensis]NUZ06016.1 DUF2269 domain-containing protein [Schlegelella koreensis]